MKKTISIILIFITFLIIYFLQANFFSWFTIAGIKPNLFILLTLFISLFAGVKIGTAYGVFIGLFLDVIIGRSIGISSIMYGIVGILGGYFDKNFSKDSRLTMMLMVMGSTCLYEIANYIFSVIQLSIQIEIFEFIKILVIEVIYNVILTIILYPIIQKVGYKIEDIFKCQKILTRYF